MKWQKQRGRFKHHIRESEAITMATISPSDIAESLRLLQSEDISISGVRVLHRIRLSPDFRGSAFLPYFLKPGRPNLTGIVLVPVVEDTRSQGEFGIEIVSPEKGIICQTTVPLSRVTSYIPLRVDFPPIPDSGKGVFEIRPFTRGAEQSVRVLESRSLPHFLRPRRRPVQLLCGMIFGTAKEDGRKKISETEDNPLFPYMDKNHAQDKPKSGLPSLMNSQEGIWFVVDFPAESRVHVERNVFSVRGWAWSRSSGPGKITLEIQGPAHTERRRIQHRYCRFDLSQVVPEIPLANYAGFEVSIDRFDMPDPSTVSIVFETPSMAYRLGPISVTADHHDRVATSEETACDCCRGRDLVEVGKKEGLTLRRCQNCRLVFTAPRPDFSRIQQRYSKDYFEKEYLPLIHATLKDQRRSWNNTLDMLESFKRLSPYLFEVGSGAGYMLQEAARRDWIASGIDVNPAASEYTRSLGVDVIVGDFLNIDLPPNKFGAMVLDSTLEHLLSPHRVLLKCAQALHPGGGITIGTISDEGDLLVTQGMDFSYVGPSEHLYYFSASALTRLCESVGLRVERFWRDETSDSIALLATKRIDRWELRK